MDFKRFLGCVPYLPPAIPGIQSKLVYHISISAANYSTCPKQEAPEDRGVYLDRRPDTHRFFYHILLLVPVSRDSMVLLAWDRCSSVPCQGEKEKRKIRTIAYKPRFPYHTNQYPTTPCTISTAG